MEYPKECFSGNIAATKAAKAAYDRKREEWYRVAEELFPDYFKLDFRLRLKARDVINYYVGYSI